MKTKDYENEILKWRAEKYAALAGENGWVALAGLFDLQEGRNLIGSNPMCEVVLPERAPTFLGIVELKGKSVRFLAAEGVNVKINGRSIQKAILKSSQDPKPSFITWNNMRLVVHQHGGKYAIRIWDNQREERFNLPPLKWLPIDRKFRFNVFRMSPEKQTGITLLLHFLFGAAAGSVYGMVAEKIPMQPAVKGPLAGVLVWTGSYLGWIPALGILPPATRHPRQRNMMMIAAHLVWGLTLGSLARVMSSEKTYITLSK